MPRGRLDYRITLLYTYEKYTVADLHLRYYTSAYIAREENEIIDPHAARVGSMISYCNVTASLEI